MVGLGRGTARMHSAVSDGYRAALFQLLDDFV
jgi:hypothetical protein